MTTATGVDPRSAFRLCHREAEFRAVDPPGDGRTLEGYAAVFDQPTEIDSYAGSFEEVIKRGAFERTLGQRMPVMQFDHGNDKRTGTIPIGAIKQLREDDDGLFVRARLFETERVEDIRQAIQSQAIRGMSFKFRVMADRWIDRDGKKIASDDLADALDDPDRRPIRREIEEVDLFELGPVVFPAYDQTSVGVRAYPDGSPFNPNAVALRGILGQFGLTERCVRRHLQVFGERERQALAAEIDKTFPELREILTAAAVGPAPEPAEQEDQTSAEPAQEGTSAAMTGPAVRHPVRQYGEPAGWYLPSPNVDRR